MVIACNTVTVQIIYLVIKYLIIQQLISISSSIISFTWHADKKSYIARYIGWYNEKSWDRSVAKRLFHNSYVFSVEDLSRLKVGGMIV